MKVYNLGKDITFIYHPCEDSTKLYLITGSGKCRQLTIPRVRRTLTSLRHRAHKLDPRPQYYWKSETDCDHMHVEHAVRYPNGWTADKGINDAWDNREGSLHFEKITREEYYKYKHYSIQEDRAAEDAGY